MLEEVRRTLSQRRESVRQKQLKGIEKERRLSHIRTQRLKERKSAEEELKEQSGTELSAYDAAKRAYKERRMMEAELKAARPPSAGTKVARGTARVAKAALYVAPVKAARSIQKAQKSGKLSLGKVVIGDTRLLFGSKTDSTPVDEFIFGKRAPTPKEKGKTLGIFDVDKDILG